MNPRRRRIRRLVRRGRKRTARLESWIKERWRMIGVTAGPVLVSATFGSMLLYKPEQ